MKKFSSDSSSDKNIWVGAVIYGSLWGIGATLIIFILLALIMSFGIFSVSSAPLLSAFAIAIGSFFAGFFGAKKLKKNGILIGALCGIVLFLAFTLIGLAAFKSPPGNSTLLRFLIFITASAVGGIIGVGGSDKRKIV